MIDWGLHPPLSKRKVSVFRVIIPGTHIADPTLNTPISTTTYTHLHQSKGNVMVKSLEEFTVTYRYDELKDSLLQLVTNVVEMQSKYSDTTSERREFYLTNLHGWQYGHPIADVLQIPYYQYDQLLYAVLETIRLFDKSPLSIADAYLCSRRIKAIEEHTNTW